MARRTIVPISTMTMKVTKPRPLAPLEALRLSRYTLGTSTPAPTPALSPLPFGLDLCFLLSAV